MLPEYHQAGRQLPQALEGNPAGFLKGLQEAESHPWMLVQNALPDYRSVMGRIHAGLPKEPDGFPGGVREQRDHLRVRGQIRASAVYPGTLHIAADRGIQFAAQIHPIEVSRGVVKGHVFWGFQPRLRRGPCMAEVLPALLIPDHILRPDSELRLENAPGP